jgi:hypothetical protein
MPDKNWLKKHGVKRNQKSYWYDTIKGIAGKASSFDQYPAARKHRFIHIGHFNGIPSKKLLIETLNNKGVKHKLKEEKITWGRNFKTVTF